MNNTVKKEWDKYVESKILSVRRGVEPSTSNKELAKKCEAIAIELVEYCSNDLTNIEYDNPSEIIIGIINGILIFGMINEEGTEKCAMWYALWVDAIAKKIKEGQREEQIRDFLKEKRIYDEVANAIICDARVRINNNNEFQYHKQ